MMRQKYIKVQYYSMKATANPTQHTHIQALRYLTCSVLQILVIHVSCRIVWYFKR